MATAAGGDRPPFSFGGTNMRKLAALCLLVSACSSTSTNEATSSGGSAGATSDGGPTGGVGGTSDASDATSALTCSDATGCVALCSSTGLAAQCSDAGSCVCSASNGSEFCNALALDPKCPAGTRCLDGKRCVGVGAAQEGSSCAEHSDCDHFLWCYSVTHKCVPVCKWGAPEPAGCTCFHDPEATFGVLSCT